MRRAIALARELNDTHALAVALFHAAFLSHFERHSAEVERLASDLLELATRQNFALWLTAGEVLRGWARGVFGSPAEGLSRIENGIRGYRAAGSMLNTSWALALKAECLHLAVRTSEALTAIEEIGATEEGDEKLLAVVDGYWESTQSSPELMG
jgi:predicted ATPase